MPTWPAPLAKRAREAACPLSGEGHDTASVNVELLADIRAAFGDDDVIRSADLVATLIADPERPWAGMEARQAADPEAARRGSWRPSASRSETVHIAGLKRRQGIQAGPLRGSLGGLPSWSKHLSAANSALPKRPSVQMPMALGTTRVFRSVHEDNPDGSKNDNLSYSHAGLDAWTDRKPEIDAKANLTTTKPPLSPGDPWAELGIPPFLDRRLERLGAPAISAGSDDDLGDF